MKDHRISPVTCPSCGVSMEGAFNTNSDRMPRDGDPCVCVECRSIGVYAGDPVRSIRPPTREELDAFLADPHVQKVIWALGVVHQTYRPDFGGGTGNAS